MPVRLGQLAKEKKEERETTALRAANERSLHDKEQIMEELTTVTQRKSHDVSQGSGEPRPERDGISTKFLYENKYRS